MLFPIHGIMTSRRRVSTLAFLGLLSLLAGFIVTASFAFAGAPGNLPSSNDMRNPLPDNSGRLDPCDPTWSVVSGSNPGFTNRLNNVAAVSANDVWAVGYYHNGTIFQPTLIEHWDGTAWSVVPSPSVGTSSNRLNDVAVVYANDVWAVGYYVNGGVGQTLIEHWDGTAWSVVPSPNVGVDTNRLDSVAVVSANDVWAVGSYVDVNASISQTLIEHWDGTAWSVVPSPNVGTDSSQLDSVAVVSANDVWAVGSYFNGSTSPTLIEHWDGTAWSVVPSPNVGTHNYLNGVAVVSANDVWAVGYYCPSGSSCSGGNARTLIEHWDGTSWSVVASPNVGTSNNYLNGVAVVSANDVWAVGYYVNGGVGQTLTQHWDGTAWSVVASPNVGTISNFLTGVAVVSANDVWAVGHRGSTTGPTLVEHYTSPCSSPTFTPTSAPTNTFAPTNTPTSTPTLVPTDTPSPADTFTPTSTNTPTEMPIPTDTPTLMPTLTHTNTPVPADTPTSTATNTPAVINLVGHVTWAGSTQPHSRQMQPLTLTLCSTAGGGPIYTYPATTDASGFFTVNVTSLVPGNYNWREKGYRALANGGTVTLTGSDQQLEMGAQRGGDANGDNVVSSQDFTILKNAYGGTSDLRADFNNDGVVSSLDFNILRNNYGLAGAPVSCP